MQKDSSLHMKIDMPNENFPIKLWKLNSNDINDVFFPIHWHAEIEFLFFTSGSGNIQFGSLVQKVKKNDLIVVNSNEIHSGHNSSKDLSWYCLIVDSSLLHSSLADICDAKYISPITQNLIIFKNKISNNVEIINCIQNIIREYETTDIGFELAIKSDIYKLLTLLLRNYVKKTLSPREYLINTKNLERFKEIFKYIDQNYSKNIHISTLCNILNVGESHFCRLFKSTTGKTLSTYINQVRIGKAEYLLNNTDMNITEIAISCGFNEISYFSRVFKKYKKVPPSNYNC